MFGTSSPNRSSGTPAQMRTFVWAINPATGKYDIFNKFTGDGNAGNLEVIKSEIYIRLSTFQGEWAPDPTFGIPLTAINENSDNPDVIGQILANQILQVKNVNTVAINKLDYNPATRKFSASFNVNTLYGNTTVTI